MYRRHLDLGGDPSSSTSNQNNNNSGAVPPSSLPSNSSSSSSHGAHGRSTSISSAPSQTMQPNPLPPPLQNISNGPHLVGRHQNSQSPPPPPQRTPSPYFSQIPNHRDSSSSNSPFSPQHPGNLMIPPTSTPSPGTPSKPIHSPPTMMNNPYTANSNDNSPLKRFLMRGTTLGGSPAVSSLGDGGGGDNVFGGLPGGGSGVSGKRGPTLGSIFTPRKRLLVILSPFLLLFLFYHFSSDDTDTSQVGPGGSQFPSSYSSPLGNYPGGSRRTDSLSLRSFASGASRKNRNALGMMSELNFSDPSTFSTLLPPFTFCPSYSPTDDLGMLYGSESISKTRAHFGNTERIRKMIKRGMNGLPITIGVLGGSVSSCHGLDATGSHPLGNPIGPNCYPHRLFRWLNDVFPHPANELTNGALRRTGTSYFGFCSEMHLPDRADLIIVEFDTEDPHDPTTLSTTDLLIRSLLLRPDSPAVIMLGHFSPQIQGEHGFTGPEVWHTAVAQFYDIPHLTVKGFMYDDYLMNPSKVSQTFYLDPMLANFKGHELLADVVISFLEQEICQVWDIAAMEAEDAAMGLAGGLAFAAEAGGEDAADAPSLLGGKGLRQGGDAGLDAEDSETTQVGRGKNTFGSSSRGIPPFRINDRPQTTPNFREIKPSCASANDLINPLPQSVFAGSGWGPVIPKPEDEDERHYWFTEEPGSLLKIPVRVGAGDIAVYYLRGPTSQGWGTVLCWVDDNTAGAVELRGSWERDYGQPTVTQIDRGVSKGAHYVMCELQGDLGVDKGKFKIYGIFST